MKSTKMRDSGRMGHWSSAGGHGNPGLGNRGRGDWGRGGWGLGWGIAALLAVAVVAASGCSTTKPTELVPGVSTQVQVPKDLSAVQVEVDKNGQLVFCQDYDVDQSGFVTLPATLGVVPATSAEAIIKVTIRGYDEAGAVMMSANCPDTTPAGASPAPRVLRTSVQSFVNQHTLFLPMALSYSCYDVDCSGADACSGTTCVCKGAQCVDANTNAATLADFDPALIDGTGICFNPSSCFESAVDATPVDAKDCVYAAPPGAGINVRVFYEDVMVTPSATTGLFEQQISDSGESEILNEDPQEGFCLGTCGATGGDGGDDASAGAGGQGDSAPSGAQLFQLAPGLCSLVHAATTPPRLPPSGGTYHAIGNVQVATGCASKGPLLPICETERSYGGLFPDGAAPDGEPAQVTTNTIEETPDGGALTCGASVPLASAPSVVYLVADDSSVMNGAFGATGYATLISASLDNSVFDTTYAAFRFFPEAPTDAGTFGQTQCTSGATAFTTPAVPFGLATEVQPQIVNLLGTWTSPGDTPANPAPLDLQAALRPDVGAYDYVRSFLQGPGLQGQTPNVAAVMAFVNRIPNATDDCNPPLEGAQTAQLALEAEIRTAYEDTPSVQTYFVVLANSSSDAGTDGGSSGVLAFYQSIQTDLPQMVTVVDATPASQEQVLENFALAAAPLGSCLYEPIAGAGVGQLNYTNLADLANPIPMPADSACTAATQATANGWALDDGRVRVCGASCTNVQDAISEAAGLARQNDAESFDVTVNATVVCAGDDGGSPTAPADAGIASSD